MEKIDVKAWQTELDNLQNSYQEEYAKYKELSLETKTLRDINKYIDDSIRDVHQKKREVQAR